MVRINFDIDPLDYSNFQEQVGKGNISSVLRQYVKSCIGKESTVNEELLRKRLEIISKEKYKIDVQHDSLTRKLEAIEQKKKQEEIKRLEKLRKRRRRWQILNTIQ